MVSDEMLREAEAFITSKWGKSAERVISECKKMPKINLSLSEYANKYCVAQGGNLGGMLISGLALSEYKNVYDAIPSRMGKNGNEAFLCIVYLLVLLGVDASGG